MFVRHDSDFTTQGSRCSGWLYLPDGVSRPPVVIMAHGFGAEKVFRLPEYAARFADHGLAVYVFDYRNFGDSEGRPRNLVDPVRHLEDWQSALAHVRGLAEVDSGRLGLWGTSFAGGHVIVTAARDQNVRAVVSQVPFVDGRATLGLLGPVYSLKATAHALRDYWRALLSREPHTVPVVGRPGEFAAMNKEDAWSGYLSLAPPDTAWRNEFPARGLIKTTLYRPITQAHKINCPVLVVLAEKDNYIPKAAVEKMARLIPRSELVRRPVGHFDVYVGAEFETVVEMEADFLVRHLAGEER